MAYYSIITEKGKALEAAALADGKPVILTQFVVGDGAGQPVVPQASQTTLVNETWRGDISDLIVSPEQPSQMMAKLVLPSGVGGFTVREMGLLTDAGELYAVANCAAIDKPASGVEVNIQFRLAVSDTASVTLNVATGDGLFLRIDQNLADVKDAEQARQNLSVYSREESDKHYAPLSGNPAQTFWVKSAIEDKNAAVPVSLLQSELEKYLPTSGGTVTGNLDVKQTTTSGQLRIVGGDFVEKQGIQTDTANNIRYTSGFRIKGFSDMFVDMYHQENIGQFHFFGIHVANSGSGGWFEFRNEGSFLAGNTVGAGGVNGAKLYPDGNIYGSVWGGDLIHFLASNWNGAVFNARRGGKQLYNGAFDWIGNWEAPEGCYISGFNADAPDGRRSGVYFRRFQLMNKTGDWWEIGD